MSGGPPPHSLAWCCSSIKPLSRSRSKTSMPRALSWACNTASMSFIGWRNGTEWVNHSDHQVTSSLHLWVCLYTPIFPVLPPSIRRKLHASRSLLYFSQCDFLLDRATTTHLLPLPGLSLCIAVVELGGLICKPPAVLSAADMAAAGHSIC